VIWPNISRVKRGVNGVYPYIACSSWCISFFRDFWLISFRLLINPSSTSQAFESLLYSNIRARALSCRFISLKR